MNTNNQNQTNKDVPKVVNPVSQVPTKPQDDSLVSLVSEMKSVNPQAPNAQANATSISDNNGGRITLVDDTKSPSESIKK